MEEWEQIKNTPVGYFISNEGRIKVDRKYGKPPIIKNGSTGINGYKYVWILGKNFLVHRIVAEHFIEKPDGCNVVNHLNGIKTDNRAINLEWTTPAGNNRHAFEAGIRHTYGEGHWKSIPKENVYKIYDLKKQGKTVRDILKEFPDYKREVIRCIFYGKNWRHEYVKVFGEAKKPGIRRGSRIGHATSEEKVLKVYELKKKGYTISEIADRLELKYHTAKVLFNGTNWNHLYKIHFPGML